MVWQRDGEVEVDFVVGLDVDCGSGCRRGGYAGNI